MASDKNFLDYVLDQLSALDGVTFRAMMGEYILYYNGRIFGGIYDNRLLIKPVPSALRLISDVRYAEPYEGAKPMIITDIVDNSDAFCNLVRQMYDELPEVKPKKKK